MKNTIKSLIKKNKLLFPLAIKVNSTLRHVRGNKMPYINMAEDIPAADGKTGVIYTCITGGYDVLREPLVCAEGLDYVAYTDTGNISYNSKWQMRNIPDGIAKLYTDKALLNRYMKFHPTEFFGNDYDYAIYIDGNIIAKKDLRGYYSIVHGCETGIALHRHYKRKDIYEECEHLLEVKKGDPDRIKEFAKKCEDEGLPRDSGLYEACIIAEDLKNKTADYITRMWFDILIETGCKRDQIILPYLLWKEGIDTEKIANLGDSVYDNPLFKKVNHR